MTMPDEWLTIESLDLEAQGVAHDGEGKVVFVEDALPGEEVRVQVHRRKNNWEQASLVALRRPSSQRVVLRCPNDADERQPAWIVEPFGRAGIPLVAGGDTPVWRPVKRVGHI